MAVFLPAPVLQQPGDVEWEWVLGDRDYYWGFSVRPYQANEASEIIRMWVTSDNRLNQTTHFIVRKLDNDPGLMQFSAIRFP
ncbi:hypothetical protein D5F52_26355 (plasmid) [Brevibacillus laterosporus]|uniref:Uncharacterized protein n=1 Tax=Brevibacillus laterosporus TaxID=1465 RepID=A0AAP3GE86_BRELA|nr:hypothetical protein [Brevibacillus laterosporus]AYB41679.1 hypothetical protein D5F52_26355 [Brevibacillus laterosporus]MBG9790509.1 hypothetical protein [Brevibacillus laterosporus]MCR8983173.1 hypothetical protein [Brevibacillus laterosporus]MCZ0810329.1 hypothetical protein [Brevibacillus laterosporus]MCZ0853024.1 hypothetical protein [Brevibacillus laterosporus]